MTFETVSCKKTYQLLILYIFLFSGIAQSQVEELRIPLPRSEYDISHDYHKQLLLLALKQTEQPGQATQIKTTVSLSQGRAIKELIKGDMLDVYWLGTSKQLESDLLAIKVPTTRGLIGYRKFIIHKDSLDRFNNVKSFFDLQKLSACQGTNWPDTEILKASGLEVTTTTIYENIFKMLDLKRCDYFPRGYHDAQTELKLRRNLYPNLISFEQVMLHYPFAVYFFTNKNNHELAARLELGLKQLANNGSIVKLMQSHPLTENVYPLKNEMGTLFLDIPNPLLSDNTDVNDPKLWILPTDFNIYYPVVKNH
ncbi:hypothetical protein KO505_09575 [Psychrosphaera sp. F3M07]|uniref:hypothetical protein n=1 Tax=Psychrosphaera sp. F3M07 TaxID=2841560 RepID=UPI001C07FB8C|nr:hypothetical protein [Psychrosphaera sp. F3M07]MBU2918212.1 hypothetical protein [Psychrosphaera sp. F3M07]